MDSNHDNIIKEIAPNVGEYVSLPLVYLYLVLMSGRRDDVLEAVRSISVYAGKVYCIPQLVVFVLVSEQTQGWQAVAVISLSWLSYL
jgi:hypothetical protein